jgi:hypothetical protein
MDLSWLFGGCSWLEFSARQPLQPFGNGTFDKFALGNVFF